MDREGFGRANGPVNLKQRDITGPPGEPTGTPFSRGGHNQLGLGQLGHDPPDEAGASIHTYGDSSGVGFLTLGVTQASHDVGRDRELDVGRHIVTVKVTELRPSQARLTSRTRTTTRRIALSLERRSRPALSKRQRVEGR
jgi:hypothetical protein